MVRFSGILIVGPSVWTQSISSGFRGFTPLNGTRRVIQCEFSCGFGLGIVTSCVRGSSSGLGSGLEPSALFCVSAVSVVSGDPR